MDKKVRKSVCVVLSLRIWNKFVVAAAENKAALQISFWGWSRGKHPHSCERRLVLCQFWRTGCYHSGPVTETVSSPTPSPEESAVFSELPKPWFLHLKHENSDNKEATGICCHKKATCCVSKWTFGEQFASYDTIVVKLKPMDLTMRCLITPIRIAIIQKTKPENGWARMWRNWNPWASLVRM